MLGGEVKNSSEMLTIIIPVVFGPGIPAGVVRNTSGMPAIIPAEFRRNAGNHSGRIPAGIPVEYRWNAGNNSGSIPAGIPVQYRRNAGNNFSGIPAGSQEGSQREKGCRNDLRNWKENLWHSS